MTTAKDVDDIIARINEGKKPGEEYTRTEAQAIAAVALAQKDEDGFSIFAGNLVTDRVFRDEETLTISEDERALGRKVYTILKEVVGKIGDRDKGDVRIDKAHPTLDTSTSQPPDKSCAYVRLQLSGYNDGGWRSNSVDTSPHLTKLAKRLRKAVPFTPDSEHHICTDFIGGMYGGGAFYFHTIQDLASAVVTVVQAKYSNLLENGTEAVASLKNPPGRPVPHASAKGTEFNDG